MPDRGHFRDRCAHRPAGWSCLAQDGRPSSDQRRCRDPQIRGCLANRDRSRTSFPRSATDARSTAARALGHQLIIMTTTDTAPVLGKKRRDWRAFRPTPTPSRVWFVTAAGLAVMLAFFVVIGRDFYRSTLEFTEQQARNVATLAEQ